MVENFTFFLFGVEWCDRGVFVDMKWKNKYALSLEFMNILWCIIELFVIYVVNKFKNAFWAELRVHKYGIKVSNSRRWQSSE